MSPISQITLEDINRKLDLILEAIRARTTVPPKPTDQEREEILAKSKLLLDKLKKEAEDELAFELERRREKGIGRDGDAITEDDIRSIDMW